MAQYPNARIKFSDIMTAISNQLVDDAVVPDNNFVSWGTPDNTQPFIGNFDVLMVARAGVPRKRDGGPADFQIERLVDLWYRSEPNSDSQSSFQTWLKTTFAAIDNILNSVGSGGFWPEDADGNLLTIEAIDLETDSPPNYSRGSVFGDYACTLRCIYYPLVNPSRGIFPVP